MFISYWTVSYEVAFLHLCFITDYFIHTVFRNIHPEVSLINWWIGFSLFLCNLGF